jgi:anti-sigma regulatory factor (Ser/Thr protein kinase)
LRDWGSGEDPSRRPEKTDPLTPGGLGLVCMRRLMDELKFEPQKDGMILVMSKKKAVGSRQ